MDISIVTTSYNSEKTINDFYIKIKEAIKLSKYNTYEIIIVDDGSKDNSCQKLNRLSLSDPNITIIELSKNFGHHYALMTGLKESKGNSVFMIDSDLEEDPLLLVKFKKELDKTNSDVVYGVQKKRKGGFFERISGYVFYKCLDKLLNFKVPRNILTIRLMKRKFVDAVLMHKERVLVLHILMHSIGFKQHELLVNKLHKGESEYTIRKKLKSAIDTITSYSSYPLKLIFYFGFGIFFISCSEILVLILNKIFLGYGISGWASIMVSIWFFGGVLMISLGILGIYISRIFTEIKRRPMVMIDRTIKNTSNIKEIS